MSSFECLFSLASSMEWDQLSASTWHRQQKLLHTTPLQQRELAALWQSWKWRWLLKLGSHWILGKEPTLNQGNSENDDPEWNGKCSCSVLETLDSSSVSTLKWCNEEFLQSPSCFCCFPPHALKASELSLAGRRYMLHTVIVWRKAIGAACLWVWWRLITNTVWHFITGNKLHCMDIGFCCPSVSHNIIKDGSQPSFSYNHWP